MAPEGSEETLPLRRMCWTAPASRIHETGGHGVAIDDENLFPVHDFCEQNNIPPSSPAAASADLCSNSADPFMRATWPRPFSGGKIPFRHACGLGRKSPSGTSACRFPDGYALHGAGTQATSKRQPPCCATGFCTLPPLPVCPVPGKTVPGTGGKHSIQQRRTILRPELTAVSFHYALRGKKRKKCPPTISGGHFLRKVQATGHEH